MKRNKSSTKNEVIPEAISKLKSIWQSGRKKRFEFCVELHKVVLNEKADKKSLKQLYKKIHISRRLAEKYRKIGEVFGEYLYAHVSAYQLSHLIRLASLEGVGKEIVRRNERYTIKQLDLICKHKEKLDSKKEIDKTEDFGKAAEESEKEEREKECPFERISRHLKNKMETVQKGLGIIDDNVSKLTVLSQQEEISFKKMRKHSQEFENFLNMCSEIEGKITGFKTKLQNQLYSSYIGDLGKESSARHSPDQTFE